MDIANLVNDPFSTMKTLSYNGDVQYDLGNLNESKSLLGEAHKIAIEQNNQEFITNISIKLCNIFKDMAYVNGKVTSSSIQYLDKA